MADYIDRQKEKMADYIDRQTAIDIFHVCAPGIPLKRVNEIFSAVPSAQAEQSEMIKDIRKWINSGNRGSADYFIVDKIEEIINKYE